MAEVFEIDLDSYEVSDIQKYISDVKIRIKDGDIIENLMHSGYRNNGKYIWWKGKVCELSDDPDDYGTLPRYVQISDENGFTPYHWIDVIDHNSYIWFSKEILERLVFDEKNEAQTKFAGEIYTFKWVGDSKPNVMDRKCCFFTDAKNNIIYAY